MKITEQELAQYPEIPLGQAKNIKDQKYGRLIPQYRVNHPKNLRGAYWLCKCDCGNYTIALGQNVIQHKTNSCGCLCSETSRQLMSNIQKSNEMVWNKQDLIGMHFGEWEVLSLDTENKDIHHRKWICKCSCGKIASVFGCNLGRISFSCGHQKKSIGEEKIKELLVKNNISFETEKVMFKYSAHGNARFDFYVNSSYLIEYDGTTHYTPIGGWNNEEAVQNQQERDAIKNQWCKENNIPLIRIPYTHLKDLCIEDLLLETSQFII